MEQNSEQKNGMAQPTQAAQQAQPMQHEQAAQPAQNVQNQNQHDVSEGPLMAQPGPPVMPPIETQFPGVDQGLPGYEPSIAEYGTTPYETAQASQPLPESANVADQGASDPSAQQIPVQQAQAAGQQQNAQNATAQTNASMPNQSAQATNQPTTLQTQGFLASASRSVKIGHKAFDVSLLITIVGAIISLIGVFVPYVGISFMGQERWATLMSMSTTVSWVVLVLLAEIVILAACKEAFAALVLNANLAVFMVFVVSNASSLADMTGQNAYMKVQTGAAPWLLIIGMIVMLVGTIVMFYNQHGKKLNNKRVAAMQSAVSDQYAQSVSNYYNNVPNAAAAPAQGPSDAYAASVSDYYNASDAQQQTAQGQMPASTQASQAGQPSQPAQPAQAPVSAAPVAQSEQPTVQMPVNQNVAQEAPAAAAPAQTNLVQEDPQAPSQQN
ncbi:Fe-S oxidoreductase [Bifidobacterium dolichotidis]|uniref:Fe-S oxidoreductase n=1 Tax=Bifidobacterium dolichotidis TaxID=2306976 RepID=A0A430FPZ8_9BIFI|nr:hypothetical protein [Bifidobacterium dolichotidis]RSX54922.1 Fe-S oxidoreductase [Bifidobacterium dolichotidis]